jgi:hypothetical protein
MPRKCPTRSNDEHQQRRQCPRGFQLEQLQARRPFGKQDRLTLGADQCTFDGVPGYRRAGFSRYCFRFGSLAQHP